MENLNPKIPEELPNPLEEKIDILVDQINQVIQQLKILNENSTVSKYD
jgi:hypothetical protein